MRAYLLIDFGSTYTKLSLVDIENRALVKRVSTTTTVATNIKIGFEKALALLKQQVDFSDIHIVDTLACSSAAGGLEMVAIGITPAFTVEAAKSAALGAGARLLKAYSYKLCERDIQEIEALAPDIILLTGGAQGGNTSYIIHNANMLADLKLDIPIVVAGNSDANEQVEIALKRSARTYAICENVMPDTHKVSPEHAREVIRQIFMQQIVHAKGMEDVEKIVDEVLMPTPMAVLKAAQLLAKGLQAQGEQGQVMIVDIGGATTDVHTVSKPVQDSGFMQEGLEEPYLKRTVEGDLGMRYSALSLYETVGEEGFLKHCPALLSIEQRCLQRYNTPEVLFEQPEEILFDEIMAKNCVERSVLRHCGSVRTSYRGGKTISLQKGKDLRNISIIVGTGGILVNSRHPAEILQQAVVAQDNFLLPIAPRLHLDKQYILSAMGLLSTRDEHLAFEILKDNLLNIN